MSMTIDISRLSEALAERGLTQAELARRSNVSRATLAKLLNGKATRVHPRTGQRLASALGLPEHDLDVNGIETAYLSKLAEQHRYLDFTGMGVVSAGEQMPLDRGYVPVMVRERDEHTAQRRSVETCSRPTRPRRKRLPSFSLDTALTRFRRFFLLGEPGAGKTTALRYLARKHAMPGKSQPPHVDGQWVPIFVRLAEWSQQLHEDETVDVVQAALAQLSVPDPAATAEWLKERACRGDVLLLLDGLDEVADPGLQGILIERIRQFVREHREVHVVITSRPVGFERPTLGATLDALLVQPLYEKAIRTFVVEWSAFRDGHDAGRKCAICDNRVQQLGHAIIDHRRIRALAANPMMLTVLCLLHESGASLPQRRCELYEKIVEAFLFSWEQRKRTATSGAPDRRVTLEEREIKWLLESLALDMQRKDMTLAPRWWLSEKSTSFLRDELGG
ncbi:MAG: NACHT domain-containing protein, partial [Phycisphaerales bacterium]